ncbi:MAG TPA: hypothetical protein PK014_14655 [Thermoanaerobaculia bacterium]|nr:hypothetical protein [Thermoanaerobaculia bacterium]HUM30068.1 hypothetical protein [Thermoanaerobaculia bacterium]HXK69436.1 hypothetical protein [Thermoanaerobaculia bacterium]
MRHSIIRGFLFTIIGIGAFTVVACSTTRITLESRADIRSSLHRSVVVLSIFGEPLLDEAVFRAYQHVLQEAGVSVLGRGDLASNGNDQSLEGLVRSALEKGATALLVLAPADIESAEEGFLRVGANKMKGWGDRNACDPPQADQRFLDYSEDNFKAPDTLPYIDRLDISAIFIDLQRAKEAWRGRTMTRGAEEVKTEALIEDQAATIHRRLKQVGYLP